MLENERIIVQDRGGIDAGADGVETASVVETKQKQTLILQD